MYINKWNINTAHLQSGNWIILLLLLGLNLDKPFQTVCHCGELLNRHARWIFKFAHYNFLVFTLRIPLHGRSFKKNNAVQYFLLQATLGEREGESERERDTNPRNKMDDADPVDPACAFSPVHTVYIYIYKYNTKTTSFARHLPVLLCKHCAMLSLCLQRSFPSKSTSFPPSTILSPGRGRSTWTNACRIKLFSFSSNLEPATLSCLGTRGTNSSVVLRHVSIHVYANRRKPWIRVLSLLTFQLKPQTFRTLAESDCCQFGGLEVGVIRSLELAG